MKYLLKDRLLKDNFRKKYPFKIRRCVTMLFLVSGLADLLPALKSPFQKKCAYLCLNPRIFLTSSWILLDDKVIVL